MLERDNLLAIHARARSTASPDVLRAQIALFPLFASRGPHAAFMALVEAPGAPRVDNVAGDVRLGARHALVLGRARQLVGTRDAARRDFERSLALAHELHDAQLEARAHVYLGTADRAEGRMAEARDAYSMALALFDEAGDARASSVVLSALAALDLAERRLESARDLIDRAIAMSRELADHATVGMMLIDAGVIRQELGDFAGAAAAYEEAAASLEELGHSRHAFIAEGYRASLAFEQDDFAGARARYEHALEGIRKVGEPKWTAVLAAGLGASLARLGDLDGARQLMAEAESIVSPRHGAEVVEPRYVATVSLLCAQLDVVTDDLPRMRERIAKSASLLGSSDDVRFALRVLDRALAARR
jgi:tetratricopeptide (TPR) repeat protein